MGLTRQQRWRARKAGLLPPYNPTPISGKWPRDMTPEEKRVYARECHRRWVRKHSLRYRNPDEVARNAALNSWLPPGVEP